MGRVRLKFGLAAVALLLATGGRAVASSPVSVSAKASPTSHQPARPAPHPAGGSAGGGGATIWVQTMDSCKRALGGAAYTLSGGGVSLTASDGSSAVGGAISPTSGCPLERGSCSGASTGCVSFSGVPAGTYTIKATRTPPANATNPDGYAPCEGGSACQSEVANVTVSGSSASATVTDVYPDGTSVVLPTGGAYAGTSSDPIVFHDFGLAQPGGPSNSQCDGDSDADDYLTGTPGGHCGFPEAQEGSGCQPFPWSCQISGGPTGVGSKHGGSGSSGTHRSGTSTSGGNPSGTSSSGGNRSGTSSSGKGSGRGSGTAQIAARRTTSGHRSFRSF